jgi:hypothetical protein
MSDAYNQDFKNDVESFLCRYPLSIDGAPKSLRFVDLGGNRLDTSDFFQASDLSPSEATKFRSQVDSLPKRSALDAQTRESLGESIAELKGRRDPQQQTVTTKRSLWSNPWGYLQKGKTKRVTTTVNVDSTSKACYCTIQKEREVLVTGFDRRTGGKAPRDKSTSQPLVSVQLTSTPQATGFKVYYLPWRHDALSFIELGNEADYFFTASLTGCTVYVAGPLASPTVFHANGKSLRGMGTDAASVARTQNYMNYVLAMVEEERGIAGDAQMLRSPGGTSAPANVRDDYRFKSIQYQDAKIAKHGTNVDGLSTKACTTVAGSRNPASGAWTFWYQVWASVPYTKSGVKKEKARILHVEQLWPSVVGRVSVQPADFLPAELK